MSRLYLRCVICSRQQADGLISGAAWARLELPRGAGIEDPAAKDSVVRCCPSCSSDPSWQEQVLSAVGLGGGFGAAHTEAAS